MRWGVVAAVLAASILPREGRAAAAGLEAGAGRADIADPPPAPPTAPSR